MNRMAMTKNAEPNRMLIRLPMIGYAALRNKLFSASSGRLLRKDRNPRETKPAPKAKSPAPVNSLSRCLRVFMPKSIKPLN